ncbi:MAG: Lrp/AsnC family transcriptional regulator [Candidatus Competibacteraceae bacterium]|nr:Lrp/AsnC family transcriptional regulator [Candidatus Competibacteraceae bacterium]
MIQLDNTDKRLLQLLEANARASTVALARQLGISRGTVQNRIDRLLRQGVIQQFTIRYNESIERSFLRAHVLIKVTPKMDARLHARLRKLTEVSAVYSVSGNYDIMLFLKTATIEEIDRTLDKIRDLDGVESTVSSLILASKFHR